MRSMFLTAALLTAIASAQAKQISLSRTGGEVHIVAHVGDTLLFNTTDDASGSTGFVWRGPHLAGDPVFSTDAIFVKAKDYAQLKKLADAPTPDAPPKAGGSAPHFGDHFARLRTLRPGKAGIEFIHSRFNFDQVRDPQDTVCDFVVDVKAGDAQTPPPRAAVVKVDQSAHIRRTLRVRARLTGFTMGDYLHAEVTSAHGSADYVVMDPPVAYFLALHRRQRVTLIVQEVDMYIPEAASREIISQVSDVRLGASRAKTWWNRLRRHASNATLVKKYDPLVQSLIRTTGATGGQPVTSAPKLAPVVIAVDGWVVAVKSAGAWSVGGKTLGGRRYRFRILSADSASQSRLVGLAYTDDSPQPLLELKGVEASDPPSVYVAGGREEPSKFTRIAPQDAMALKIARQFAADENKSKLPIAIQDGVRVPLGSTTVTLLAVGSGATLQTKSSSDYAAVLYRVGAKTQRLVFESKFGQMRGPFTSKILAVADFDGSGSPEALVSTKDPWGEDVRLVRLTPSGATELNRASRGE